jgi:NAD(P)-dependent dehydrogenase (short-subunit alcohol dehydrogenase family)
MNRNRKDRRSAPLLLPLALAAGAAFAIRAAVRRRRWMDLTGRVVFITGGSRGFGLLLAREFAGRGVRVAICARDFVDLERAVTDLAAYGVDVFATRCDLLSDADVRRAVAEVTDHFGRIDVLVNNAGTIAVGPMEEMTLDDYRESIGLHFWAPLHTSLAVLPQMKRRGGGRIVNVSSIGGKIAAPHLLPYSAGKFALVGLSEGMRAEVAKDNVFVTTVCPGLIRTGSPRNAWFKGQHRKEHAWFALADSLPVLSMDAARGARRVVLAAQRGEAEVILGAPAKVATMLHGLLPGTAAEVGAVVNRLLPGPGGIGTERRPGRQSRSFAAPSALTALTERAAAENNELGAG